MSDRGSAHSAPIPAAHASGDLRRGVLELLLGDRAALTGLVALGAVAFLALIAPVVAPHDPASQFDLVRDRLVGPSAQHLMGTDALARDVLSRLLYGARVSLIVALCAVTIGVTTGAALGAAAGLFGGWVDAVVMRLVDVFMAIPRLVLIIAVMAAFEPSLLLVVLVLGFTLWPATTRIVRSEVLAVREKPYVEAAGALGYSRRRILLRHVAPNIMAPVIVAATLGVGHTIVLESGLSFLGLGVPPPTPSWGTMIAEGRSDLLDAWWLTTFPGLAIVGTVLALNLVGDGLRDALDPRLDR